MEDKNKYTVGGKKMRVKCLKNIMIPKETASAIGIEKVMKTGQVEELPENISSWMKSKIKEGFFKETDNPTTKERLEIEAEKKAKSKEAKLEQEKKEQAEAEKKRKETEAGLRETIINLNAKIVKLEKNQIVKEDKKENKKSNKK